jgi:hypothetical protein
VIMMHGRRDVRYARDQHLHREHGLCGRAHANVRYQGTGSADRSHCVRVHLRMQEELDHALARSRHRGSWFTRSALKNAHLTLAPQSGQICSAVFLQSQGDKPIFMLGGGHYTSF